MSFAIVKPKINASYFASLLVALKSQHIEYVIISLYGDFRTSPKPVPYTFDSPLVYNIHGWMSVFVLFIEILFQLSSFVLDCNQPQSQLGLLIFSIFRIIRYVICA